MPSAVLRQVKRVVSNLNPEHVRESAEQPVSIGLVAASEEYLGRMETYFAPPHLSPDRRAQAVRMLVRGGGPGCDIEIYESSLLCPAHAFSFDPEDPEDCVRRILRSRENLMLPLARNLYPFRKPAAHHVIRKVARENALFCLATALPDLVPSLISLPWAVGEFGSDAAFLTGNQIRMAFQLAAASDRPVGYREQKPEIASIVAGAFGWRASKARGTDRQSALFGGRTDSESGNRVGGDVRGRHVARTVVPPRLPGSRARSAKLFTKKPTKTVPANRGHAARRAASTQSRQLTPPASFRRPRLCYLALASLAFTYLFCTVEYLSPLRRVHIPYDLEGFHYPLADYAFQALKHGRFPQWDAAIYSGISFVGNSQAAIFYPPVWLMFAANWGRQRLSYQSLQVLVIAHVWLAFLLCYVWLRGRQLSDLACVLGAGVFAFSGYMCLQLQHLGLIGGYTWFPLGFMGIDEAFERRSWRPFWKLVAASALCFLAGYPPTWFVFAVCMATYAIARPWRITVVLGTAVSLGVSLVVSMIQVLPAWESAAFMVREERYGSGIKDPRFFLSYLFPNFFNFGWNVSIYENPGMEYLYLGAPALLGIALLFRRRNPRALIPFLAVGAVSFILLTNPYNIVWNVVRRWSLLGEICRSWYFLAGITAAAAPLAAYGLDDFLTRKARPAPRWLLWLALVLLGAWSSWELLRYLAGDVRLASGWRSVFDPAITTAILALALFVFRAQQAAPREPSWRSR